MENLDVFDELYNPLTPSIACIDDVHKKGLWHQTFACWIVNPQKNSLLMQLRGARNRIDPGSLDASASGHLATGEKPEDGFRELHEELGISIPVQDRQYLGFFRNIAQRDNYINNEFSHVFLAQSVAPLSALTLQHGEVSGVFEIQITDAIDLLSYKKQAIQVTGIVLNNSTYEHSIRNINMQSLCNWKERCGSYKYYLKIMQATQAYLKGAAIPML